MGGSDVASLNQLTGKIHLEELIVVYHCCCCFAVVVCNWFERLFDCVDVISFFFAVYALQLLVITSVHLEGDPCRAVAPIENSFFFLFSSPQSLPSRKTAAWYKTWFVCFSINCFAQKCRVYCSLDCIRNEKYWLWRRLVEACFPPTKQNVLFPLLFWGRCIRSPLNFH